MNWKEPEVFAVKHKNLDIRMASRSGGIFTALSDCVLDNNGVIYGCVLNQDYGAVHIRAESIEDRNRMRGSKYIQSNMGDIFKAVQEDLESDISVLFSGTSCQIDGLKGFLRKEYKNLFCIDIVCYGVPSPFVWKEYLKWQEEKNGRCVAVDFRNKKDYGWANHVESLTIESTDGKQKNIDSRVFNTLFYGHSILRPCCYKCPYKSTMHPGDVTIADYWGIDKAAPGFNDNRGVSLVLVNNEAGSEMFNRVKGAVEYRRTRLEDSMQPALVKPFEQPIEREQFWKYFYNSSFEKTAMKYGGYGWKNNLKKSIGKVKRKVKSLLNKMC